MKIALLLSLSLLACAVNAQIPPAKNPLAVSQEQHRRHSWKDARYNFFLKNAAGAVVATYEDLKFLEPLPGTGLLLMGRGFDKKAFTYRNAEAFGLANAYTGREVAPCTATEIRRMSLCAVWIRTEDKKNILVGISGEPLHKGVYQWVEMPVANKAYYSYRDGGKSGLLDSCGRVKVPARYDGFVGWEGKSARVQHGGKYTLLDANLTEIGPPRFTYLSPVSSGLYAYSSTGKGFAGTIEGGKLGFMNERGEFLSKEVYEAVSSNSTGLIAKLDGQWISIDPRTLASGGVVTAKATAPEVSREFHKQAKFGYYKYGYRIGNEVLVKEQYDAAFPFFQGYAVVGNKGRDKVRTFGGDEARATEYGLINLKGEEVIKPRYKALWPYGGSLYGFGEGGDWESSYRYGIMDSTGAVRVPAQYLRLGELREGLIPAKGESGYGYVDLSGKTVIAASYKHAFPFVNGTACVATGDHSWFWIDRNGREILPGRRFTSLTDWDSSGKAWVWNVMDKWNRPDSAQLITRAGVVLASRPRNGPPPPPAPPPPNSRKCSACGGSGFAYKAREVDGSFTWYEGMFRAVETRTTYSWSYTVYDKAGACRQCGGDGWE
jgi:hypothetical protein